MNREQLIIVAGFSCAGKTSFLNMLKQPESTRLCKKLNYDRQENYFLIGARGMKDHLGSHQHVILHYDFYAVDVVDSGFQMLRALVDQAQKLTIVTLCASPAQLQSRLQHRVNRIRESDMNEKMKTRNYRLHAHKLSVYESPLLQSLYEEWFDLLDRLRLPNTYITHTEDLVRWNTFRYDRARARALVLAGTN